MGPRIIEVIRSANLIVRELLALKPGEQLGIICDSFSSQEMVYALAGAAESVGAEYCILQQPSRQPERKNELSPVIELAIERCDAVCGITGSGGAPTYARRIKQLLDEKRLRVISMVMRDNEIFTRGGATADYKALLANGNRLAEIWRQGSVMHITSPAGTDIKAPTAVDDVIVECGYANEMGMEAAFSDGEVSCRPVEGTAEGVIVIDGPSAVIGMPSEPIRVTVKKGRVVDIGGDSPQAKTLRRIVATVKNADNIAEFGIGLNPACVANGRFEEEKKARGNIHIAFGDNIFYGGTVESKVHMDMVIYRPTVTLDDRLLVDAGRVLVE